MRTHLTIEQRFWAKVNKDGSTPNYRPDLGPCWLWTGSFSGKGYGRLFSSSRRLVSAHRIAYELLIGSIPDGKALDHLCRVHACVNPAHLEPVTNRENTLRGVGVTALHSQKTHCIRGHELIGSNLRLRPTRNGRICRACDREDVRKRRAMKGRGKCSVCPYRLPLRKDGTVVQHHLYSGNERRPDCDGSGKWPAPEGVADGA